MILYLRVSCHQENRIKIIIYKTKFGEKNIEKNKYLMLYLFNDLLWNFFRENRGKTILQKKGQRAT